MRGRPAHPWGAPLADARGTPAGPQAFGLLLGLGPVPASLDDVRHELAGRLDQHQPRLWWERGELRLGLTVRANDLWLASSPRWPP